MSDEKQDRKPIKRYQKPRLIEYGSVAKLTRGSRSVLNDATGGGKKSKACL